MQRNETNPDGEKSALSHMGFKYAKYWRILEMDEEKWEASH